MFSDAMIDALGEGSRMSFASRAARRQITARHHGMRHFWSCEAQVEFKRDLR
jgi:hypothetical protein